MGCFGREEHVLNSIEERARGLGIELAGEAPPVAQGYQPAFAPYAFSSGELIHLSGRLAKKDGALLIGKVGAEISLEAAKVAAREIAIELLSVLKQATGDLDRVQRIVRLLVMVNGAPGFNEPHRVADGASELFAEVFGAGGAHARSAMVAAELPFGAAVEIDLVAEIHSQASGPDHSPISGAFAKDPQGRSQ